MNIEYMRKRQNRGKSPFDRGVTNSYRYQYLNGHVYRHFFNATVEGMGIMLNGNNSGMLTLYNELLEQLFEDVGGGFVSVIESNTTHKGMDVIYDPSASYFAERGFSVQNTLIHEATKFKSNSNSEYESKPKYIPKYGVKEKHWENVGGHWIKRSTST